MRRTLVSIGAALVIVLFVAVVVRADAPATTYYACVNTFSGTLRVVGAGTDCGNSDQLISWNQAGPQGPQGPVGPIGPQGPAGANGVSGYTTLSKTIQLLGGPIYDMSLSVDCPTGEHVMAGGYSVPDGTVFAPNLPLTVFGDAPTGSSGVMGGGWTITFNGAVGAGFNSSITVYAICASAG